MIRKEKRKLESGIDGMDIRYLDQKLSRGKTHGEDKFECRLRNASYKS
jgi:hypothetical protein